MRGVRLAPAMNVDSPSQLRTAVASVVLTALLILLTAAPALAAERASDGTSASASPAIVVAFTEAADEEPDEGPPTTEVSEGGVEPAQMAPPVEEDAAEDQWTAKFLAPLVAVLGVLGIILAAVMYGVRLRGRYRVVD